MPPDGVRSVVKPLLEILAGIPTVVYGFFAVLTVAPAMREFGELPGLLDRSEQCARRRCGDGHHADPVHLFTVR